jgi:hypothetical protein
MVRARALGLWKVAANNVYFYKYPAGGKPIKTLKGFDGPAFAAVSVAQ